MRLTYLLPLRRRVAVRPDEELARYLRDLSRHLDVLVVDGSAGPVRDCNADAFGSAVTLVAPNSDDRCANGKAWGVISGLRRVRTEGVVIADDDVRWDAEGLGRAGSLLDGCALVVPQNYFTPMVWHAGWDTGRTLLNRSLWHDWPGTMALRTSAVDASIPYCGDVLFENCELLRTVRARGGRVHFAPDLFVARRPPTLAHFLAQRPRQAYDDLAQPARFAAMLVVLPLGLRAGRGGRAAAVALCIGMAELGRRRHGSKQVFPWYTSLGAPLWLGERSVLAWWVAWRAVTRRGVHYVGVRLTSAATPQRVLNRRSRRQQRARIPTAAPSVLLG